MQSGLGRYPARLHRAVRSGLRHRRRHRALPAQHHETHRYPGERCAGGVHDADHERLRQGVAGDPLLEHARHSGCNRHDSRIHGGRRSRVGSGSRVRRPDRPRARRAPLVDPHEDRRAHQEQPEDRRHQQLPASLARRTCGRSLLRPCPERRCHRFRLERRPLPGRRQDHRGRPGLDPGPLRFAEKSIFLRSGLPSGQFLGLDRLGPHRRVRPRHRAHRDLPGRWSIALRRRSRPTVLDRECVGIRLAHMEGGPIDFLPGVAIRQVRPGGREERPGLRAAVTEDGEEGLGVRPAVLGVLLQCPLDGAHQRGRQGGTLVCECGQVLVLLLVDDAVQALAGPRTAAGQHLPADQPERVEVAASIQAGTIDLLGRHVGRRTDRCTRKGQAGIGAPGAGNAEIGEARHAGLVDIDVLRLDVAVNDTPAMRVGQRRAQVAQHLLDPPHRQRPVRLDLLLERAALDVLHDQREAAIPEAPGAVQDYDVGVLELAHEPGLAHQPSGRLVVLDVRRSNDLDGDQATQLAFARQVYDRRPAPAELPQDLVIGVQLREARQGGGRSGRLLHGRQQPSGSKAKRRSGRRGAEGFDIRTPPRA